MGDKAHPARMGAEIQKRLVLQCFLMVTFQTWGNGPDKNGGAYSVDIAHGASIHWRESCCASLGLCSDGFPEEEPGDVVSDMALCCRAKTWSCVTRGKVP